MADARLISVNPLSGLQTWTAEEDGKQHFIYRNPYRKVHADYAESLRDDASYTKQGIKNDMLHYAHIDDETLTKMFVEDKINPFAPEYRQAVNKLLNTKYRHCLTTKLRYDVKG